MLDGSCTGAIVLRLTSFQWGPRPMARLLTVRNLIILLLVLGYFPIGYWLTLRYITLDIARAEAQQQQEWEDRWVARFRQASPAIQEFHAGLPNRQEAWSQVPDSNVVHYYAYSRASDDLVLTVWQSFELTEDGLKPSRPPAYYREVVLDDYEGFYAHSLKTISRALTPDEFELLYRQHRVANSAQIGPARIVYLRGGPSGYYH